MTTLSRAEERLIFYAFYLLRGFIIKCVMIKVFFVIYKLIDSYITFSLFNAIRVRCPTDFAADEYYYFF